VKIVMMEKGCPQCGHGRHAIAIIWKQIRGVPASWANAALLDTDHHSPPDNQIILA
jgi:hypothetical protein